VLRDISFTLYPGQTAAVIGSTGSGKSTLADLLLRLHDVGEGAIRVGGVDVRTLTQQERIGCVPQKAFLFSGTIAENLRMGRPDATDEVLWRALGIAQAADFVERLPLGLDAPVAQGGTNFSGGQRQRLSIARALVKDAGVLLFDDSFSALDVKTDAALRRALREQVVRPAKLIVAQRVSTILDADLILVLDEGRLVGAGTHGELLETCPVYRAIADSQMQREGA
jgi:ATP-binding cassette subfamily B multidrug efflux pump